MHRALLLFALLAVPSAAHADPPIDDTLAGYAVALAERPHDTALLRERAELLLMSGQPARALDDLRVALALAPDDASALVLEGQALEALGEPDEALATLDRAVALAPTSFAARRARADLRVASRDRRGAIEDLDAALALTDDVDAFLDRGRWLVLEGRAAEAAQGLDEALARMHDAAPLLLAAVDAHLAAGESEAALVIVEAAVLRTPTDPRLVLLRGDVLVRLGRASEARAAFEDALVAIEARLSRHRTTALLVDRGETLLRLGRVAEAQATLDEVSATGARYPRAAALAARLQGVR